MIFSQKNRATKEAIFRDKVASFLLPEKNSRQNFIVNSTW
uniref:Uncharacterized protein n=1 Tax=Myoviridae sp. ctZgq1 TaxID=2826666 RepID=A0A8S5LXK0_9CAUD|nr:MAG TPA: hypothetical protein [Myoviridae sp. ctZgq1]